MGWCPYQTDRDGCNECLHPLERRERQLPQGDYYTAEWETKAAISTILDISTRPIHFSEQLTAIIRVLTSISWLGAVRRGAIFVANCHRQLVLVAHHNLNPQLVESCDTVPFGKCLCGKAAESKEVIFKECMDHDHEITYAGIRDHGHYVIPLMDDSGELLGVLVLYLEAGHEPHPEEATFIEMLQRTVSNILLTKHLRLRNEISQIRLQQAQMEMLHKLVAAAEFRDDQTGSHIKRIAKYCAAIGRELGLAPDRVKLLEMAAPMHDIGKVGIPDRIMLKPGRLSETEFAIMQQHTQIGARLLSGHHPLLKASREIALTHHEKWDGSGYPHGLAGEDIPLFGRICAVADVFDALMTSRPYKKAWSLDTVLEYIREQSGSHFDPAVVDAFMKVIPQLLEIKASYSEDDSGAESESKLTVRTVHSEFLKWDDSLSIGVDGIDGQHKYFINLINRIYNAIEQNDALQLVEALLDMIEYSHVHFAAEQRLMEEWNYPALKGHICEHQQFIQRTEQFLDELEASPLAVRVEVLKYVSQWALKHIRRSDAAFGRFLAKEQQAAVTAPVPPIASMAQAVASTV
ncbi:MAG: bacteriohemerythrin [Planctomycetes bacterium]|nr:bacteriohemerythrin [Planctomycetota bacterium]